MSRRDCLLPTGLDPTLRRLGIDPRLVLSRAGVSLHTLRQPRARLDAASYHAIWQAIADESGEPSLGFQLVRGLELDLTEPLFLAVLAARSVGDAIDVLVRYKRMLAPEELTVEIDDGTDEVTLEYTWPAGRPPQLLVDVELSFLVEMCRRATHDSELSPERVRIPARQLPEGAEHERFFRCPIVLEPSLPSYAITFSAESCQVPFLTHNGPLLDALLPYLAARLPARSEVGRVREAIGAQLTGRRPTVASVGRAMAMSTRALQRLLTHHGTSFREILAEVRRERATDFVRESELDAHEIAFLLGYGDAASFQRAFREWNGVSVREYRRRH
ncbi:MAG: AraC family transcriptional regulator ligand-binding domain-containing protein [Myxococcales bacterium]|nr:AraC family transcriptional regulator ligand-binding domain-containing protein [Myxococcales bacterium]